MLLVTFAWLHAIAISAAMFRLRGSETFREWTGRGATTARLLWAAYLTACAMALDDGAGLVASPWLIGAALLLAIWLGAIGGWWRSLDMGSNEGTVAGDLAMHSLRGLLWTVPAALVVWLAGMGTPWPLIVAGLLCGPIYLAARRINVDYATQGGEWGFGAAYALALGISVAEL